MVNKETHELFLHQQEILQEENIQLQESVKHKESAWMNTRKRFQTCTQHCVALAERYDNDITIQNTIISKLEAESGRLIGVVSSLQQNLEEHSAGAVHDQAQETIAGLNDEIGSLQKQLSTADDNMTAILRTCAVYKEQAQDWENRARRRAYEAERNGENIDHEQTITSQAKALLDLTTDYNVTANALTEARRQFEANQTISDAKAVQQDKIIKRQGDTQTDLKSRFRTLQVSNKTLLDVSKSSISQDNFTTAPSVEFDRMRDDYFFLISHAQKQEIMVKEAAKECASLQIEHVVLEKTIENGRRKCREYEESDRMLKVYLDSMELKHEMLEGTHERVIAEHSETIKNMANKVQQRNEELDKVVTANISDQFR